MMLLHNGAYFEFDYVNCYYYFYVENKLLGTWFFNKLSILDQKAP